MAFASRTASSRHGGCRRCDCKRQGTAGLRGCGCHDLTHGGAGDVFRDFVEEAAEQAAPAAAESPLAELTQQLQIAIASGITEELVRCRRPGRPNARPRSRGAPDDLSESQIMQAGRLSACTATTACHCRRLAVLQELDVR